MYHKRFTSILFAGLIGLFSLPAFAEADSEQVKDESTPQIQTIDINAASAEQLMQLDNIGPSKAQAIIEYRETNGSFETPQDLRKVKGIGAATIQQNSQRMLAGQ